MQPNNSTRCTRVVVFMATALLATAASAHTGTALHTHTGFSTGFVHPFTGMDHLAAMLAVGIWSALAARRAGPEMLWGPLGFATMLLVGALYGLQGLTVPGVEPMIAASLLVTGLLVVTRWRLPGPLAAMLVGAFAVFHGLAHGYELSGMPSALQTLFGMLVATAMLHAIGMAIGWSLRRTSAWVPRLAGMAVAVFGLGLLAQLA